jgi:hypothetical protein
LKKTVHNFKKCMPFKKLFIISIFGSWFSKNVSLYFLKLFKIFKKLFKISKKRFKIFEKLFINSIFGSWYSNNVLDLRKSSWISKVGSWFLKNGSWCFQKMFINLKIGSWYSKKSWFQKLFMNFENWFMIFKNVHKYKRILTILWNSVHDFLNFVHDF